jgi:hypothetical protein
MFYKRISDLHPLGYTTNNWNDVQPMPIPEPGVYHDVTTSITTTNVSACGDIHKISPASNTGLTNLDNAFNSNVSGRVWHYTDPETYSYNHARLSEGQLDPDSTLLSSEYYAKSLWFEVAVTKGNNEKPTSDPTQIKKYQSKRVNAFTLFTNIDEISAKEISAELLSANTIVCKELSSNIITSNIISTDIISGNYGDFDSISTTSITADGISAFVGVIDNISGDNIYYKNGRFNDIEVSGVANLTAEAAYWADIAEIYTADKGYLYGTLVKFGGEKEITIADDKANAVVSEKPAITLNSGNREEHATPIVLTGRSKVRTIHPVKKFDKIYLSETPGVGCVSSYKISSAIMPIGIALEDKHCDEEGMVECILQLNFE